ENRWGNTANGHTRVSYEGWNDQANQASGWSNAPIPCNEAQPNRIANAPRVFAGRQEGARRVGAQNSREKTLVQFWRGSSDVDLRIRKMSVATESKGKTAREAVTQNVRILLDDSIRRSRSTGPER